MQQKVFQLIMRSKTPRMKYIKKKRNCSLIKTKLIIPLIFFSRLSFRYKTVSFSFRKKKGICIPDLLKHYARGIPLIKIFLVKKLKDVVEKKNI